MTEFILLLYMQEEDYGKRLLRFLLGKKNPHLHPELVTSREMINYRVGTETQKVIVLTDQEEIEEDENKIIILLTSAKKKEKRTICQYQKADGIYEDLLMHLGIKAETSADIFPSLQERRGIIFLLSVDMTGATAVATILSQYLGRQGSCLYLNLTGFPVWYGGSLSEEPDFQMPGVDELLFISGRTGFAGREREIRRPMGQAWLIPPFRHYKDLLDSTKDDWQKLFHHLQMDCGYDSIVVEVGPLMEHTLELLSLGDEIFFLMQKGLLTKIRINVWKQYCRRENRDQLPEKIKWIMLPEEWQDWEERMIGQPLEDLSEDNQLMAKINALLNENGEEENNVLWEDFG